MGIFTARNLNSTRAQPTEKIALQRSVKVSAPRRRLDIQKEVQPMKPSRLWRWCVTICAIGGAIVPILDIAVITMLGRVQPNYSHVRQFISELGETGRPFAGFANLWFVLVSTMFGGFAIALFDASPRSRASTVAALLFGVWSATGIIGGFFPCDPGCAGETLPGAIHVILGLVGTICVLPVPSLFWLGVRGDPRWRACWWFTLAVQGVALASFLLLGAVYFRVSPLDRLLEATFGLIQRCFLGVYYTWTAVIGLKIARTSMEGPPRAETYGGVSERD